MSYVRGHYRRDGSYVRPHYRRSRRSTGTTPSVRPPTYHRASTTVPSPRSVPAGPTTRVRGHYRNGYYVRPHYRRISTPAAVAVAGGGGGLLLLLIVLALVIGGGGGSQDAPGKHPTTSVSPRGHTTAPR